MVKTSPVKMARSVVFCGALISCVFANMCASENTASKYEITLNLEKGYSSWREAFWSIPKLRKGHLSEGMDLGGISDGSSKSSSSESAASKAPAPSPSTESSSLSSSSPSASKSSPSSPLAAPLTPTSSIRASDSRIAASSTSIAWSPVNRLLPAVRARTRMRAAAGEFPRHFLAASLLLLNLRRRRRRRQGMRVRDMPLRTVPGRVQVMTPLLLSQYASRCSLLLSIFMLLFLSALLLQTSDLPALIGWEQACGEPKRTPRPGRPVNPAEPPQLAEPVPKIGQSGPPPERAARRAGIGSGPLFPTSLLPPPLPSSSPEAARTEALCSRWAMYGPG